MICLLNVLSKVLRGKVTSYEEKPEHIQEKFFCGKFDYKFPELKGNVMIVFPF